MPHRPRLKKKSPPKQGKGHLPPHLIKAKQKDGLKRQLRSAMSRWLPVVSFVRSKAESVKSSDSNTTLVDNIGTQIFRTSRSSSIRSTSTSSSSLSLPHTQYVINERHESLLEQNREADEPHQNDLELFESMKALRLWHDDLDACSVTEEMHEESEDTIRTDDEPHLSDREIVSPDSDEASHTSPLSDDNGGSLNTSFSPLGIKFQDSSFMWPPLQAPNDQSDSMFPLKVEHGSPSLEISSLEKEQERMWSESLQKWRNEYKVRLDDDCWSNVVEHEGSPCPPASSTLSTATSHASPQQRGHERSDTGMSGNHPKRKDENSNDEDEDGGEDERRGKRPRTALDVGPKELKPFACPYYKRNPNKYSTGRSCGGLACLTVHRVKEHLYRKHMLQCYRCGEIFDNASKLRDHAGMENPCKNQELQEVEGFGAAELKVLRKRDRGQTEVEKWNKVYMILFPNDEEIPSPFYENPKFTTDLLALRTADELAEREGDPMNEPSSSAIEDYPHPSKITTHFRASSRKRGPYETLHIQHVRHNNPSWIDGNENLEASAPNDDFFQTNSSFDDAMQGILPLEYKSTWMWDYSYPEQTANMYRYGREAQVHQALTGDETDISRRNMSSTPPKSIEAQYEDPKGNPARVKLEQDTLNTATSSVEDEDEDDDEESIDDDETWYSDDTSASIDIPYHRPKPIAFRTIKSRVSPASTTESDTQQNLSKFNLMVTSADCCDGSGSADCSTGAANLNTADGAGSVSSGKRPLHHVSNSKRDQEEDHQNPNPKRNKLNNEMDGDKLLACPYAQRNAKKYEKCRKKRYPNVHRLKEHLYRIHRVIRCVRCGQIFVTSTELSDHLQLAEPCVLLTNRTWSGSEGFHEQQEASLKSRKRTGRTASEKWNNIYRILFPLDDEQSFPSPFYKLDHTASEAIRRQARATVLQYQTHQNEKVTGLLQSELDTMVQGGLISLDARQTTLVIEAVRRVQGRIHDDYQVSIDGDTQVGEASTSQHQPGPSTSLLPQSWETDFLELSNVGGSFGFELSGDEDPFLLADFPSPPEE